MRTIQKYDMQHCFEGQPLEVPACAKFLHFADQDGRLTAWFEVEDQNHKVTRTYRIIGTGWEIPSNFPAVSCQHLATCQQGHYIWHLYEQF